MSQQSTNRSFDDLARALAEGSISRRRALKLFAGTAIASLIPSRALAGDDDDCVRICHVPFDRDTKECDFDNAVTRCVSRRERRRHLENHPCDCRGRCANCLTTCLPNGGTCMANDDCCSGNCAGGTCAAACTSNGGLISCLAKTATPSTVTVGALITFTITEQCPEAAGCVESFPLVDHLPSGLTVISVTSTAGSCITSGNTVTCGSRSFGPAAPFTLTIVAIPTVCGGFTNTASNGRDTAEASFTVLC